jgi:hypothetical protein
MSKEHTMNTPRLRIAAHSTHNPTASKPLSAYAAGKDEAHTIAELPTRPHRAFKTVTITTTQVQPDPRLLHRESHVHIHGLAFTIAIIIIFAIIAALVAWIVIDDAFFQPHDSQQISTLAPIVHVTAQRDLANNAPMSSLPGRVYFQQSHRAAKSAYSGPAPL